MLTETTKIKKNGTNGETNGQFYLQKEKNQFISESACSNDKDLFWSGRKCGFVIRGQQQVFSSPL